MEKSLEFSFADTTRLCEHAIDRVGRSAIDSALSRVDGRPAIDQLQFFRMASTHPMLDDVRHYRSWRKRSEELGQIQDQRRVVRLAHFGWALTMVDQCVGYGEVVQRLADPREYSGARYEVEVAAAYLYGGAQVTFLPRVAGLRTPDLEIFGDMHGRYWVECKVISRLDEQSAAFDQQWNEVEAYVQRAAARERRGWLLALLAVSAEVLPTPDVIRAVAATRAAPNAPPLPGIDEAHPIWSTLDFGSLPFLRTLDGNYAIGFAKCQQNDLVFRGAATFAFPDDFTRISFASELRVTERGEEIRNPRILLMGRSTRAEKFRRNAIRNAISRAASQLPQSGPGIVKVRLPDYDSDADREQAFAIAQEVAGEALRGGQNRRVNAICIESMQSILAKKGSESQGAALLPWQVTIIHDSPRLPFQGWPSNT